MEEDGSRGSGLTPDGAENTHRGRTWTDVVPNAVSHAKEVGPSGRRRNRELCAIRDGVDGNGVDDMTLPSQSDRLAG